MAHFDWAVVRCMDGRLNKPVAEYLQKNNIPEEHDLISIPGGPKDLLDNEQGLFKAIEDVSLGLHHVKNVLLLQHTDCGKYGGRPACGGTEEKDLEFQKDQLQQAMKVLVDAHPEVEIKPVVAHILDSGEVEFKDLD